MIQKLFRRMIFVRKASVCINISRVICRRLKRIGFHVFCRRKAAVNIQTMYRGNVARKWDIVTQKQKSSNHTMCQTFRSSLPRRCFLSLCRWRAAVKLQKVYRGFVARTRFISSRKHQLCIQMMCQILCRDFLHCVFLMLHRWRICWGFVTQ